MATEALIETPDCTGLTDSLRRDLLRVAIRDRWERLFHTLGWLHLASCGAGQWLYLQSWHRSWQFVCLWCLEVGLVLLLVRVFAGRRWYIRSPLAGILMRVWATFFLVAFGSATLNTLTGFAVDWFKLSWASLSTFGWATTAALLGWPFLIPAFQMYFTGLLMTKFPQYSYAIFGLSWFISLQCVAAWLLARRAGVRCSALTITRRPRSRGRHHLLPR